MLSQYLPESFPEIVPKNEETEKDMFDTVEMLRSCESYEKLKKRYRGNPSKMVDRLIDELKKENPDLAELVETHRSEIENDFKE